MKIHIVLIMSVLCLCCMESRAQRRLPGQQGIQLLAGLSDGYGFGKDKNISFYTSAILSRYTKNSHKWLYGLEYWEKRYCYKCRRIPTSQITLEGGYYYNFLSDRGKNVFFSVGLSVLAGYETTNWGKKVFPDGARLKNKDKFIAGAGITLEIETFITDYLVFLINARERVLNSDVGQFHSQFGIGLKYIYK